MTAALGCGAERALAFARAPAGHRCVAAVAEMARRAREGYPEAGWVPPGCCAVLRQSGRWEDEWTAAVREKIEQLTAARSGGGVGGQEQPSSAPRRSRL